jgi:glycosyltransferase involved in cell wall biosynthesis
MTEVVFPGRVGLQQRVLPAYRAPFFDALAAACQGGLSVFAGQPLPGENIASTGHLQVARFTSTRNRHIFNPASPFYQCWQPGLLDWLDDWQPDVLIVEANPRYPATPQAVRWMKDHHRPVLGWGLGAPPLDGWLTSWRRAARSRFLRSLDGLIAYSQRGAQEYLAQDFPAKRVFVATNAATPRPQTPAPSRPAQFVSQPVLLFVGRLQARKRIDNLLRACAALPAAIQPRLLIVGDGPAREELEILAKAIYPSAEFTGERRGLDLEPLFAAADLFVLPGTGGLAVQQAMAYSLPVIVAEGDGTQDDLVRSSNGWRVPPGNLSVLTETIHLALSSPARLRAMGAESYRIVSEEINLEKMVEVFIQALISCQAGITSRG